MNENEMKNATIADIDEVTTPVAAAEDAAAPIQEPAAQDETNTAEVENLAPEACGCCRCSGSPGAWRCLWLLRPMR